MTKLQIPDVETYKKDGRMHLNKVYSQFLRLKDSLWIKEILCYQQADLKSKQMLPILAFRTRQKGDAIWLISGIHGEEPAGVNALAKKIRFLNRLAKKIPIVLIPLANPSGYRRNWRYPTLKKPTRNPSGDFTAPSVGSSEHFLIDAKTKKARFEKPINEESKAITSYIITHAKRYKPLLVLDLHEDESAKKLYIYSQGKLKNYDPIARKVVNILKKNGFRFYEKGKTSFNEKIIKGVVSNIEDGSIDELLSANKIIVNKQIKKGPDAKSVIVIETKTVGVPLKQRIKAHTQIITSAKNIYALAKDIFDEG